MRVNAYERSDDKDRRQLAALRDVEAALDNLIEVVDAADDLPILGSRASGAIAAAAYAAQPARAIVRDEIRLRIEELSYRATLLKA